MSRTKRWLGRVTTGGLTVIVAGLTPIGTQPANAAPAGDRPAVGTRHAAAWRFDGSLTTMAEVNYVIGADKLQAAGVTGAGVGVALVDTGVSPVDALAAARVVNGPDLSFDSQVPERRYVDGYGHGTHLAGIIAGSGPDFRGVAPGATLTSVKVGSADGAVDVSQVIAAVDWVVAHRADDPAHPIRVLNLSYGTDGTQDYRIDPLTHAVENAWRAGIVVVVAAGNGGRAATTLTNPAYDPYVVAVGAADNGTAAGRGDDRVADFSSRGNAGRHVDLVAPGRSVVSLLVPGSTVDTTFPTARVGSAYFKGSGTSQAAAVVSGAAALLLQQRPDATPDQVKAALIGGARHLALADDLWQGAGELNLVRAARLAGRPAVQTWPASTGTGSLDAARGSVHIGGDGFALTGESDLFGPFDAAAWAKASAAGASWVDGVWMGRSLAGTGWIASSWASRSWASLTWSSINWSSLTWSSLTWSSLTWSSLTWSSLTWSGSAWS